MFSAENFIFILVVPTSKIWLIGSSLVHWAEARARKSRAEWSLLTHTRVTWYGQRGMKWDQLLPKIKAILQYTPAPDMICIHLGGNDLASTPLRKLTCQAKSDMNALAKLCPHTTLVWSDILARISYRNASNDNKMEKTRKTLNSALRAHTRKLGGKSIRHPGINWDLPHLFRNDGVHLNDRGNDIFLGNLQGSITCFDRCPSECEFPIPIGS